jgi:hypothetical protein
MKYTLLEMTQDILSNMSSDEVNSISDTSESMQVATIIKQKYFDIINRVPLPEHEQLVQLDASLDVDVPVIMYVPDKVADLKWIKYYDSSTDTGLPAPGYLYVTILPPDQFIDMVGSFNTTESNVETFDFVDNSNNVINGTYTLNYKTDRQPLYCTIISNYYVIFDSYDSTQDSTLQASKTQGWGRIIPHWSMTDTFIPNLAEEQFQLLLNEAKALAFFELKQQPHQLALQETKRGWSTVQKNKAIANRPTYFNELANFGRRSGVYYGTRGFGNGYSQGWNQWQ